MISIVCVTKNEPHAAKFLEKMQVLASFLDGEFVVGEDGCKQDYGDVIVPVCSDGYIESVLDAVLSRCSGDYILRLDDDEFIDTSFINWLKEGAFVGEVYSFPRMNLWKDQKHYITNKPLYPDMQTRFTTKEKAGGRQTIHSGSPFGIGFIMPFHIVHHKFLVKSYEERKARAETVETFMSGAGLGFYKPYSLPEDCFAIETEEL